MVTQLEKNVLEMQDVTVSYGEVSALEQVNLTIPQGRRVAIVGPNGAGKSTLMKAVLGLESLQSGRISLFGEAAMSPATVARRVAYIPQSSQVNWQFPATVFEIVLMGRFAHIKGLFKRPTAYDKQLVEAALEKMNLQDVRHRQIDQLSGGQRQRVFIARALVQEADLYLMDEPLAGVDQLTEGIIMDTLKEFQAAGKTSMVIHHDVTTLEAYFDHLVWLNRRVVASGPLEQVLTSQHYQAAYGLSGCLLDREGAADGTL